MKSRKYSKHICICYDYVGRGNKTGKGLQCTQLGDEVNKYSNPGSFSWSFIIIKKNNCAVNVIPTCLLIISVELRVFEL